MSEEKPEGQEPKKSGSAIGVGIAIGTGVGAALLAATGEEYWLAIGIAVGAAIGAVASDRRGSA